MADGPGSAIAAAANLELYELDAFFGRIAYMEGKFVGAGGGIRAGRGVTWVLRSRDGWLAPTRLSAANERGSGGLVAL